MPITIEGCCDGTGENCQGYSCRAYNIAECIAKHRKGPRMPTGYGDANLVRHGDTLAVVKEQGYDALVKSDEDP